MKKLIALILALFCVLGLIGCNRNSMDYIIENEPNITGIVEEVHDDYIIIYIETDGYPNGADCKVSLNVENKDSVTDFVIGDEVVVYYNGDIAESDPLQINTVYAITLKTPAIDRTSAAENQADISGIELSKGNVEFKIGKDVDGIQLSESSVITNTTKISVSANNISNNTEIEVFLYNADSLDTPILYATLTKEERSVDFDGLTSRFSYKVGAEFKTTSEDILLTITD